jgi:hypothetical protein
LWWCLSFALYVLTRALDAVVLATHRVRGCRQFTCKFVGGVMMYCTAPKLFIVLFAYPFVVTFTTYFTLVLRTLAAG